MNIKQILLTGILIAFVVAIVPLHGRANPLAEIEENDFLDLIDSDGKVLIQAQGLMRSMPNHVPRAWRFLPWGTGL